MSGPRQRRAALVVNADRQVGEMLSQVLHPDEWEIGYASDNTAALTAAQVQPFDLLVIGEKTSGSEDIDLLRKIRRLHTPTRVIILTDESTPAEVIASIREHAFSYFVKPFSLEAFADMVRIALESPGWDDGIEVISSKPEWIRLRARCDTQTAERLVQFLREVADLSHAEREAVAVAFRELLLNAIEHGAHFDPKETVEISYLRTRRMVACQIRDPGEGFGPEDLAHAAVSNPPDNPMLHMERREAEGLRPGGYGLLLARNLVDEVIHTEKGNEVTLVKYLDKPEPQADL